jgi:hypothetical protein
VVQLTCKFLLPTATGKRRSLLIERARARAVESKIFLHNREFPNSSPSLAIRGLHPEASVILVESRIFLAALFFGGRS